MVRLCYVQQKQAGDARMPGEGCGAGNHRECQRRGLNGWGGHWGVFSHIQNEARLLRYTHNVSGAAEGPVPDTHTHRERE